MRHWLTAVLVGSTLIACKGAERSTEEPDLAWAAWPMPNAPGRGLPNPRSYSFPSTDVVLDGVTGLMWQRAVDAQSHVWSAARSYCDSIALAGFDDWRLPSRIELVSILDSTRNEPSIDMTAFPDAPSDWYWSSSTWAADPNKAWFVYFYFGYPDGEAVDKPFRARCVRRARAVTVPKSHYAIDADTVRDANTGLVWQRAAASARGMAEATRYCADLALGGSSDWRMPSLPELASIVDERRASPALDPAAFPNATNDSVWSGSEWAGSPSLAWYMSFEHGNAQYDQIVTPRGVRCVR